MRANRRHELGIILFISLVLSLVTALVLYALRQNISLFYTPTQVIAGVVPTETLIRLGGMVEKGSVMHAKKGLFVEFRLTDYNKSVLVQYKGILPDLFREGQGIVTKGKMSNNHIFKASDVLAKHDANYMPPELKSIVGSKTR